MRIEKYVRDLTDYGYIISNGFGMEAENEGFLSDEQYRPTLKMSVISRRGCCDDIETLIQLADSDSFHDDDPDDVQKEFRQHYPDIVKGDYPGWALESCRVFPGGVLLTYFQKESGSSDFLWIAGSEHFLLTITAPRTRFGFDPIYTVRVNHMNDGSYSTSVREDLGYIVRENDFYIKDPSVQTNFFQDDNTYVRVTECEGL